MAQMVQQSLAQKTKELRKVQEEYQQATSHIQHLETKLASTQQRLAAANDKKQQLEDQAVKVADKCKADEQTSVEFLLTVHYQLLQAHKTSSSPVSPSSLTVPSSSHASIAALVIKELGVVVAALQEAEEKAGRNERTLESQEEALQRLQRCHTEQLQKLAAAADARAQQWQQQKAEVEQHYSQLLADVNVRHKKTQALADQAWDKVRVTGTLQQGLESECISLHRQLSQYHHEHDTLLAACSLLCGAIYPMSSRCSALAAQRNLLTEQLHLFDSFKHDVVMLTDALSLLDSDAQMPAPPGDTEALLTKRREIVDNPKLGRRALLNFRRAAIAVMAANRLAFLCHGHCHMFVARNVVPGVDSAVVCAGGVDISRREFSGVANPWLLESEKSLRRGEEYALSWLTSNQLLATVLATVGELQGVLQRAQEGEGFDTAKIVTTAQTSFQNLISHLPSMFPGIAMDTHAGLRERGSLIRFLGHGLSRVTAQQGTLKSTHGSTTCHLNAQVIVTQLRQRVLELTERLHAAEVERRDLRAELGRTTRDKHSLTETSRKAQLLQKQLASLQDQQDNCVARDKFDGVCQELNNALDRERQAEAILNEQSQRLNELNVQLDLQVAHFFEQEQKFHGATKDLSDTKTQLRHHQQVARQLNRQLSQYECDCKLLRENVKDAENALRTAVRDRETLVTYMKSLVKAIARLQTDVPLGDSATDVTSLLAPDLMPKFTSRPPPEMAACQTLVLAFVDALKKQELQVTSFKEAVLSHKRHVSTLKQELTSACQREYGEEMDRMVPEKGFTSVGVSSSMPDITTTRTVIGSSDTSRKPHNAFTPLQVDSSDQPSVSQTAAVPKTGPKHKSTSNFHTPNQSRRTSNVRHRGRTDGSAR